MKKVNAAKNYMSIIEITIVQLISYLFFVSVSTLLIVNSFLSFEYRELQFISGMLTLLLSIVYVVNSLHRNKKDRKSEQERKIAFYNSSEQVARREELVMQQLIKKENEKKENENLHIQMQLEN
jgi:Ca2+/Na+ antiporter